MHLLLLHRVMHMLQGHYHQHGHPPVRRRCHTQQGMLHARPGQPHVVRDVRHVQGCAGRWQGIQHRSGQLPQGRQTRDRPHVPVEDHRCYPPPVQCGQEVARSRHPEKSTEGGHEGAYATVLVVAGRLLHLCRLGRRQ